MEEIFDNLSMICQPFCVSIENSKQFIKIYLLKSAHAFVQFVPLKLCTVQYVLDQCSSYVLKAESDVMLQ